LYLKKYPSQVFFPLAGALLGCACFFFIYGYKILNPAFIEWTMHGDAATNFLGWHFFRSEPWRFPIGLIQSYHYPQGTGIVYTDSIPLMAFLLKPFSSLLPGRFQYHGIWLLLSYMLQGVFGWYLVSRFIKNRCIAIVGTLFFVMSPVMVQRADLHASLTAHWVLLAALYLFFEPDTFTTRLKWLILLPVTSMIHFYFLLMVGLIYGGYILRVSLPLEKKRILSIIPFPIITASLLWVAMWVQGYFIINLKSAATVGFGKFSMNILAPINTHPFSSFLFLKPFPVATAGQYEGFNYLGLGLIFLTVIAVIELIRHKEILKSASTIPLVFVCLILIGLALSNRISLANHEIFHITLPLALYGKLGIIRASGRMFWPVTYIVTLTCLVLVARFKSRRNAAIIISFAVIVQLMDFYPFYRNVSLDKFSWKTPLYSNLWGQFAEKYKHITCIPAFFSGEDYVPFALLAGDHGMTINVANLARADYFARKRYRDELQKQFEQGRFEDNTLYILLSKPNKPDSFISDFLLKQVTCIVDGYPVIAPGFLNMAPKAPLYPDEATASLGK
jgi:hypothetical protein